MFICYIDESGVVEASGEGGHFVLVGLAVPAATWKSKDNQIGSIKKEYGLGEAEIHTAWLMRDYPEQAAVSGFDNLPDADRRKQVLAIRAQNLARHRTAQKQKSLINNYKKSDAYIHLTKTQRIECVERLADLVGSWGDVKLFADAQKKDSLPGKCGDFEEAFEQVVTRFNTYLKNVIGTHGLIVQDNNATVAARLTKQMRKFHRDGTTWAANIEFVVETPLFVDSELTSMVQMADMCSYAIRRFCDNKEENLINRIWPIFDRSPTKMVGVRHYTKADPCGCRICVEHVRKNIPLSMVSTPDIPFV